MFSFLRRSKEASSNDRIKEIITKVEKKAKESNAKEKSVKDLTFNERFFEYCRTNDEQKVIELLESNSVNVCYKQKDSYLKWTPLMAAANGGYENIVKLLLCAQAGADINYADREGRTALVLAFTERHFSIVRLLLEAGAHVQKNFCHLPENGVGAVHQQEMHALLLQHLLNGSSYYIYPGRYNFLHQFYPRKYAILLTHFYCYARHSQRGLLLLYLRNLRQVTIASNALQLPWLIVNRIAAEMFLCDSEVKIHARARDRTCSSSTTSSNSSRSSNGGSSSVKVSEVLNAFCHVLLLGEKLAIESSRRKTLKTLTHSKLLLNLTKYAAERPVRFMPAVEIFDNALAMPKITLESLRHICDDVAAVKFTAKSYRILVNLCNDLEHPAMKSHFESYEKMLYFPPASVIRYHPHFFSATVPEAFNSFLEETEREEETFVEVNYPWLYLAAAAFEISTA